jgi:hypothetical protein
MAKKQKHDFYDLPKEETPVTEESKTLPEQSHTQLTPPIEEKQEKKQRSMTSPKRGHTPQQQSHTPPPSEIHLEDLLITNDEIWKVLEPHRGALKNWLTQNHPQSHACIRMGALSEMSSTFNQLLAEKLRQLKEQQKK